MWLLWRWQLVVVARNNYWETLKLSEINKSQINWNPSFVTLAWPVILLPIFLGAYQLVSPGLSAISAVVNKHKQCKHLWSYQFNNSRPPDLCLRVSLLSLLLLLQDDSGSSTALSVRVSACSTLSHHRHYHSGSSLLSQSGFRPGITLLSLLLSFRIISTLSVQVSASSSLSHLHHYHYWYCIHCLVSPGLGLLYAL